MGTEDPSIEKLKAESSVRGKDPRTRLLWICAIVLWVGTSIAFIGLGWTFGFQERNKAQTLAQQITLACQTGDFGPDFSDEDQRALCKNAEKVIKNDPELQEAEIQEREIQEPEIQEPEIQDPEIPDRERQEDEIQEPEIQDPEVQEPEIQDKETQDPEIDDPDPASPYDFTFVVPPSTPDGPSYTVTCNSGTGQCVVIPSEGGTPE